MTVNQISGEIESRLDHDAGLDYIAIKTWLDNIGRVTSTVLGVFAIAFTVLLPIVIALELIYICFPAIQYKLNDYTADNEGIGIRNRLVQFTLRDAVKAVKQSYEADALQQGSQSQALTIYFKLKIKYILIAMIVIFMILLGWTRIIELMWMLIGPIVDVVTELFTTEIQ